MNSAFFRFILDVQIARSQTSIPVSLNDTAITLYISLTDGGKPYYIEDGCLAKLSIACPSGNKIHEFCRIEGNTSVVYPFLQNPSTASEEGIHECELTLYGLNGEQITTSRFTIIVNERVVNVDDNNGITDESIGIIDDMIHEEQQRRLGEAARIEAEKSRVSSESDRTNAEAERVTAEAEREAYWGNKAAVYVGSGEMPEGYNVQIDTLGGYEDDVITDISEALDEILKLQKSLIDGDK